LDEYERGDKRRRDDKMDLQQAWRETKTKEKRDDFPAGLERDNEMTLQQAWRLSRWISSGLGEKWR
jgi:hypothetical protein